MLSLAFPPPLNGTYLDEAHELAPARPWAHEGRALGQGPRPCPQRHGRAAMLQEHGALSLMRVCARSAARLRNRNQRESRARSTVRSRCDHDWAIEAPAVRVQSRRGPDLGGDRWGRAGEDRDALCARAGCCVCLCVCVCVCVDAMCSIRCEGRAEWGFGGSWARWCGEARLVLQERGGRRRRRRRRKRRHRLPGAWLWRHAHQLGSVSQNVCATFTAPEAASPPAAAAAAAAARPTPAAGAP